MSVTSAEAAEREAEHAPGSTDPVQELKDAATSNRLLKARIEDAQQKERAPVLRDPTHRTVERHDDAPVKKAV
jgi:hypothetical protein